MWGIASVILRTGIRMTMETEFGGEGLSYGAWSSEEYMVVFWADRVVVSMETWWLRVHTWD